MRNLFRVLEEILLVIPNEEDIKQPIENLLKVIIQHASYTPPECMGGYWYKLTEIINKYITVPLTEEWEFKMISIFTTKSIEILKIEQKKKC